MVLTQRERLLERCGGLCEDCHQWPDWRGLHKHHVNLKGMGGRHGAARAESEKDENQLMLCGRCHSVKHGIIERGGV